MTRALQFLVDTFFRNVGLKLVAVGLAAVLFVLTRDEVTRAFEVPLRVVDDPTRILLTDLPRTVTVKVRGPWTRVNRLQDYELGSAALDLSAAEPGPLEVDQASIVMPSGVLLADVAYPHVDLRFEPVIERAKRIEPTLMDKPADGYRLVRVTVDPPTWMLRGGRSWVQGITTLATESIELEGRTQTFTQARAVIRPGEDVVLVAKPGTVARAEVRVEIEPIVESREIAVPIPVPEDLDPTRKIPRTVQVQLSGPRLSFDALDSLEQPFPIDAAVKPRDGRTDAGEQVVELRFTWSDSVPEEIREALSIDHGVEAVVLPPPPLPAPAPPLDPPA